MFKVEKSLNILKQNNIQKNEMKMRNFSRKSSPSLSVSRPSNPSNNSELTEAYFKDTVFGCITVFPGTHKHRRIHQIQMICFPFIPILALFIQNFVGMSNTHLNILRYLL